MQNRGIVLVSTPISNEGFAYPSARLRRSKTKFSTIIILSVAHMFMFIFGHWKISGYFYHNDI